MEKELSERLFSDFEAAAQNVDGMIYWYARDMQKLLDYTEWRKFGNAIERAKEACKTMNTPILDHFVDVDKMVEIGSGVTRNVDDIMLTRYACYLIAQNGDPRKTQIAYAQSYFATQTRKMELVEQRVEEFERLQARGKLSTTESYFSRTMFEAGLDGHGFARVRSEGDRALFGYSTAQMKKRLGVKENRPLADFLPSIAVKAKDFASEITSFNVKKQKLSGEKTITNEHVKNNETVRSVLVDRGIKPEELPKQEDIKKIERKAKSEGKKVLKETKKLPARNPMNF